MGYLVHVCVLFLRAIGISRSKEEMIGTEGMLGVGLPVISGASVPEGQDWSLPRGTG